MGLIRQYTVKYIEKPEIKEILTYFNCDFTQQATVREFVATLDYNDKENDQLKNKNLQLLMQLFHTNRELYNTPIHQINWE